MERLYNWLLPANLKEEDRSLARLLIAILLLLQAGMLFVLLFTYLDGDLPSLAAIGFTNIGVLITIIIFKLGYLTVTQYAVPLIGWLAVSYLTLATDDRIKDVQILGYPIVVMFATLLIGRRGGMVFAALSSLSYIGISYVQRVGIVPFDLADRVKLLDAFSASVLFFIIAATQDVIFNNLLATIQHSRQTERSLSEAIQQLQTMQATLEQKVQEQTAHLQATSEIARVANASLDQDEIIHQVAHLVADQFGYCYTAIFLTDPTEERAKLIDAAGKTDNAPLPPGEHIHIDAANPIGKAIHTRQTVVLNAADHNHSASPEFSHLHPDAQSKIVLPLVAGDRVLGALDIHTEKPAFTSAEIETLQNIASQLALSLNNTRLFQETQAHLHELDILYQTSQTIITATELDEVLRSISTQMIKVADAQSCAISIWDKDTDHIATRFDFSTLDDYETDAIGTRYALQDYPATARVLKNKQMIVVRADDPEADPAELEWMHQNGVKTLAMFPLIIAGRVIGLVELQNHQKCYDLTAQQIHILETISYQAAASIQHRQVLEQTQQLARRERVINQIVSQIQQSVDVEGILTTTLRELRKFLNIQEATIQLGTEKELLETTPLKRQNGRENPP